MNRQEFVVVVLMRIFGVGGLLATPAIFLPFATMNAIHQMTGLGELPDAPIVGYLARSLSAFYAGAGGVTLWISMPPRRTRQTVAIWSGLVTLMGVVLLGVDLASGMPPLWTLAEGPPLIAAGLVVVWLLTSAFPGAASGGGAQ